MSTKNIFEKAARQKLRFNTSRGPLTVEQLWDLPLRGDLSLDSIAVGLDKEVRSEAPRSFVDSASTGNVLLELKFDIVKHIIEVRMEENKRKTEQAEKAQQRKLLDDQIATKENEQLLSGSLEELKAKRAALDS